MMIDWISTIHITHEAQNICSQYIRYILICYKVKLGQEPQTVSMATHPDLSSKRIIAH